MNKFKLIVRSSIFVLLITIFTSACVVSSQESSISSQQPVSSCESQQTSSSSMAQAQPTPTAETVEKPEIISETIIENLHLDEVENTLLNEWNEINSDMHAYITDAKYSTTDLDGDENLETWFFVEDYNWVVALIVEKQEDSTYTYLGMTSNLFLAGDMNVYQSEDQEIMHTQRIQSHAVKEAGVQTYDVFISIENNQLICNEIYYSSQNGEMDETAQYDIGGGFGNATKEEYLAQKDVFIGGSALSDIIYVMELETIENYLDEGVLTAVLQK